MQSDFMKTLQEEDRKQKLLTVLKTKNDILSTYINRPDYFIDYVNDFLKYGTNRNIDEIKAVIKKLDGHIIRLNKENTKFKKYDNMFFEDLKKKSNLNNMNPIVSNKKERVKYGQRRSTIKRYTKEENRKRLYFLLDKLKEIEPSYTPKFRPFRRGGQTQPILRDIDEMRSYAENTDDYGYIVTMAKEVAEHLESKLKQNKELNKELNEEFKDKIKFYAKMIKNSGFKLIGGSAIKEVLKMINSNQPVAVSAVLMGLYYIDANVKKFYGSKEITKTAVAKSVLADISKYVDNLIDISVDSVGDPAIEYIRQMINGQIKLNLERLKDAYGFVRSRYGNMLTAPRQQRTSGSTNPLLIEAPPQTITGQIKKVLSVQQSTPIRPIPQEMPERRSQPTPGTRAAIKNINRDDMEALRQIEMMENRGMLLSNLEIAASKPSFDFTNMPFNYLTNLIAGNRKTNTRRETIDTKESAAGRYKVDRNKLNEAREFRERMKLKNDKPQDGKPQDGKPQGNNILKYTIPLAAAVLLKAGEYDTTRSNDLIKPLLLNNYPEAKPSTIIERRGEFEYLPPMISKYEKEFKKRGEKLRKRDIKRFNKKIKS